MFESELFSGSRYCEEEHIILDRKPSLDAEELSLHRFYNDPEIDEEWRMRCQGTINLIIYFVKNDVSQLLKEKNTTHETILYVE